MPTRRPSTPRLKDMSEVCLTSMSLLPESALGSGTSVKRAGSRSAEGVGAAETGGESLQKRRALFLIGHSLSCGH